MSETRVPPPDATGTSFLVLAVLDHPDVAEALALWVSQAERHGPVEVVRLESAPGEEPRVQEALTRCRTGVRILLLGDQFAVQRLGAVARAAGAASAEITEHVTTTRGVAVYCVHCREVGRVDTGAVEPPCPGCGRLLEVYPNRSAGRGAHLGVSPHPREVCA